MRTTTPLMAALLAGATLALTSTPAAGQTAPVAKSAHYSTTQTTVGVLLDDAAANAILKTMIPAVYANEMFQTQGRGITLKAIQEFEPEALSDEVLAKIQAELDKKIPAKL